MAFCRFGEGYVAFLRFSQAVEMQKLKNLMSHYFSMAKISSRQATAVRFLIPKNDEITLSETFRRLRNLAVDLDADDYSLTQSSLDQVNRYFDNFFNTKKITLKKTIWSLN